MNRGMRTLIVVTVAVVVATLATLAVYRAVRQVPVRQVEAPGTPVVVAARRLPIGTLLTRADVKTAEWPVNHSIEGGFATVDDVLERGLIADMVANEPVTPEKLAPAEAGGGLPPIIPAGMRAMSVAVNEVVGVAGFVTPGNHVDVVATMSRDENSVSRVVVSNVKVLASGTRYDQERSRSGEAMQSTVVTLLVTPEDGERIALASVEGKLHLTLRNPLDQDRTQTVGIRVATLFSSAEPPPAPKVVRAARPPAAAAAPPPPPPPVARIYTVEAIRAAKRSEEVVK
jgi:pilus assembly protein CpaB